MGIVTLDPRDRTPIYAQLERGIRAAIATGRLRPGDQLPTVRQLAVDLRVNANTVARVYVDLERAGALVQQAGREIAEQVATDVLIIEDEPIIALDIETLVQELGHSVTGIARTHKEAVALVAKKRPGLVLADIQLADGSSGLDAVNELLRSFEVPVIFITAYPERFLTGERPEPAFLIAKPFQPSTVSAVLSQALFFERNAKRRERRAS